MIGLGGLLLVVSHLFAVPDFSFSSMGRVGKRQITRLGCENNFLQDHILSTAGGALTLPCCFIHTIHIQGKQNPNGMQGIKLASNISQKNNNSRQEQGGFQSRSFVAKTQMVWTTLACG